MRSTPLGQWKQQAARFDDTIRASAESILGAPFTDHCYRQACLTPRLGGLGLRRTVDHADIAFSASWHEAQVESEEKWQRREASLEYQTQKWGSYMKDKEIMAALAVEAPNQRERQRLRRVQCEHAGAWVTAIFRLQFLFVLVFRFWGRRSNVLSARKTSMFSAITPPAARRTETSSLVTIGFATYSTESVLREVCHQ